jgi:hypothetical protein
MDGDDQGVPVREEEVIIAGTTGLELEGGARAGGMEVVLVMDGGQADVQYVAPLQFNIETEAQQPPTQHNKC